METVILILACICVALGGGLGVRSARSGARSWWTLPLMVVAFLLQGYVLSLWGRKHGHCPLNSAGEVALYIAWSQTLFYLLVGPALRMSLLGLFSTPVILLGQFLALVLGSGPAELGGDVDYWREVHLGFSVMAYGAFALSAVAGAMALILRSKLKRGETDGLTNTMSSVTNLDKSLGRLLFIGWVVFTAGIVGGFMMEGGGAGAHLWVALAIWLLYALLIGWKWTKGLPPKRIAWASIALFFAAFLIFAVI